MLFPGRTANDSVWTLVERRARPAGDEPLPTMIEPDRPDAHTSWAAVATGAEAVAAQLAAIGAGRGQRVAPSGLNSAEYIVALGGITRLGTVCVPLDALPTPPGIARQLTDAGAVALVGELDPAALDDHCRAQPARFEVPEEDVVVEARPKTSIGKVEKKSLRQRLGGTA